MTMTIETKQLGIANLVELAHLLRAHGLFLASSFGRVPWTCRFKGGKWYLGCSYGTEDMKVYKFQMVQE